MNNTTALVSTTITDGFYVQPNICVYDSLGEALSEEPEEVNPFLPSTVVKPDLEFLNQLGLVFVIGEPGHGKSILIQKLSIESGSSSLVVDCKDLVGKSSIADFIQQLSIYTHLYFDGLDEVPPLYFVDVLRAIRVLVGGNPSLHVFISCRVHYLKRFENEAKSFSSAKFIKVLAFDESNIREYLEHYLSQEEIIAALIEKSKSGMNGKSVLKTPRYLEALVRSISQSGINTEQITALSRVDIFERVIYHKLITDVELSKQKIDGLVSLKGTETGVTDLVLECLISIRSEQVSFNETYITQRVLEKLAFIMEIYQRNRITKAEMITFLDETKSNINLIFLGNSNVDTFIERTLKTMDLESVEFENTEFQEYLAAKELVRLGSSQQVLYDLILHSELKVIFVNWYDVIQYAIELDAPKIISSLAAYLRSSPERLYDERLSVLLMGPGVENAPEELKAQLFDALFLYYQFNGIYVYRYNDALARLYSSALNAEHTTLVELNDGEEYSMRQFVNRLMVTGSLCRMGKVSADKVAVWKAYLLKCLTDPLFKSKRVVYWGLEGMGALSELIAMKDDLFLGSEEDIADYISSLGKISADDTVDIFLEVVKVYPFVTAKEEFLDRLVSEAAIVKVLDELLSRPLLEDQLFNDEQSGNDFYEFFGNVKLISSAALDQKIKQLFLQMIADARSIFQRGAKKDFMNRTLGYLLDNNRAFLDELFALPIYSEIIGEFSSELVRWLDEEGFEKIREKCWENGYYSYALNGIVHQLNVSGNKTELRAALALKHPDIFRDYTTTSAEEEKREQQRKVQLHERFIKMQMVGQKVYHSELLSFFSNNIIDLKEILTTDEWNYALERVRETLDGIDPDLFDVKVSLHGLTVTFDYYDNRWFKLSVILNIALELGLDALLNRNRAKVFKYLPMINDQIGSYQKLVPRLLEFYGGILNSDVDGLLEFCAKRTDDYIYVSSKSFATLISDYGLFEFKPILKLLIETSKSIAVDREAAMEAFGNFAQTDEDRAYLQARFGEYLTSFPVLAHLANEYLILKFMDVAAISWRFDQLRLRIPAANIASGIEIPFSDWDLSMGRRNFCSCFSDFSTALFDDQMIDLLRFAIQLRKTDGFANPSNRLMKMIAIYFTKYRDIPLIKRINFVLNEPSLKTYAEAFKHHLRDIENDYASSHQLYNTISDPIKVYNVVKSKIYLPIYSYHDLVSIIDDSILELDNFVSSQGYGRTAMHLSGTQKMGKSKLFNEDILQKTMKLYLENALLKKGIRDSDIHREVELYDAKRLDLLITYGFIGPIIAELKLLSNIEIQNSFERGKYKDKVRKYIAGTNARFAYYIVFDTDGGGKGVSAFNDLVSEYADIENLKIVLVDCTR